MLNKIKEQPEGAYYLNKIVEGSYTSPVLLVGDEGVGKKFSVFQAIRESASKGDETSPAAYQVDEGVHPDVGHIFPEEGKDIGIDVVRDLLAKAYRAPMFAPYRYLFIENADRLTIPAANAILKTLEEPPEKTRFFLTAESFDKVLPTIRSRCGRVRYRKLSEGFIYETLLGLVGDPEKTLVYARLSGGSLGRAYQYFGANRLVLRDRAFGLLKLGVNGDLSSLFSAVGVIGKDDLKTVLHFLEHLLYDMTLLDQLPDQIANLDLASELGQTRQSIGPFKLLELRSGLSELLQKTNRSISLDFHLKTYLASVFVG